MSIFDKSLNVAQPSRTKFNLSYEKMFNCGFGECIPVMCDEVVPGDSFRLGNTCVVRFEPQQAPFFTRVFVRTDYFFVPYRLLSCNWEFWINGGQSGTYGDGDEATWEEQFPVCQYLMNKMRADPFYGGFWENTSEIEGFTGEPATCRYTGDAHDLLATPVDNLFPKTTEEVHSISFKKYSLEDYLFPLGVPLYGVSRFPQLAYNMIWNNYIRDENVMAPVGQGCDRILKRCWKKDYFTAALPWQQRGVSPSFGLAGGTAPVGWIDQVDTDPVFKEFFTTIYTAENRNIFSTGLFGDNQYSQPDKLARAHETPIPNNAQAHSNLYSVPFSTEPFKSKINNQKLFANFSEVLVNFDIADLRQAFAVQKFLERSATAGYRYNEFLKAMYGVSPRDETVNAPVYIGGTVQNVITSEVTQTSATEYGSGGAVSSAQGHMTGHSISVGTNYAGSIFVNEFGLIMGIMSIMPKASYYQGVNKQWLRSNRYEFFNPLFVQMSEQAVKTGELYFSDDNDADGNKIRDKVFGFQGIYDEMRIKQDMVCGDLRPEIPNATGEDVPYLDYWSMVRHFGNEPKLNKDFLECNPSSRIFTVTDSSYKQCIVHFYNAIEAVRPLPYAATPGFVDHH